MPGRLDSCSFALSKIALPASISPSEDHIFGDDEVEFIAGPDFQGRLYIEVFLQQLKGGLAEL